MFVVIALVIALGSLLSLEKETMPKTRTASWAIIIVFTVLYTVFAVF